MQTTYDNSREVALSGLNRTAENIATERTDDREAFKFAFRVWLALRIVLSILGAVILLTAPDWMHEHVRTDYPDVVLPNHDLYGATVGVWNLYDVREYTSIAEFGYSGDLSWQTAYFPGYPLLIKAVSYPAMGDYLLAALIVSNICALLFFWFLYRLVNLDYGAEVARRAVVFAALFPSSFFLFMGYTESIVLAGMVGALYYARKGQWWQAGVLAGIAALTKEPGVFIFLPLAYIYWQQLRASKGQWSLRRKMAGAWLLLSPLAALAYTAYRFTFLQASISDATDLGGAQRLAIPGAPLLAAVQAAFADNPMLAFDLMDIFFATLMIALVAAVIIRLRSMPYTLFSLLLGLTSLSAFMDGYVYRPQGNSPRRLLLIFPVFILLALVTNKLGVYKALAYTSAAMYIIMAALFANWIFIS
jgi:hypothetical protein